MTSEDFKREFNISAKIIYREWLMEAIEHDDYKSFRDCVLNLGTEWHVIRTVEKDNQDDFCKNLWDNRKKIQNGTYSGWAESPYDAYSYESKVCFLINPQYYKLIYDSNNQSALHKITGEWFTPVNGRMQLINITKNIKEIMKNIKKNFINQKQMLINIIKNFLNQKKMF